MSEQLALFPPLSLEPTVQVGRRATRQAEFEAFHEANPHVYRELRRMALWAHGRGHRRGAIELFWNRLRWEAYAQTMGDVYKLNNNYKSFYARRLMAHEPALAGFFETRKSLADPEEDHGC